MNTLNISKANALAAYRNSDKNGKKLLENLLGENNFKGDITDRIKTVEDAIEETGRPHTPEFVDAPEDLREYFKAQYNAIVVAEALNEGTKLDYRDGDQRKWLPWFIFCCLPQVFRLTIRITNTRIRMQGTQLTYAKEISQDKQPRLLAEDNNFERCW